MMMEDQQPTNISRSKKPIAQQRVAIIGGGPSGTAQLRAFQAAAQTGVEIPEVVCFEKQSDYGGLWLYSWRTGVDANGDALPNSQYRYLWSNGPKECLEFADYPFEEHFGKAIPSYPPREVLLDYIRGRVDKANVRPWCRFNTVVRDVSYSSTSELFTVVSRNSVDDVEITEEFDYVIVATGHFSTPNLPEFPGFESFEGRVLHAHDFRDAQEFTGKDILVVGSSYSAEDISSQCYKYGVKSVTLSYRTAPMPFHWPDNFTTVPLLEKVTGDIAHFKDGQTRRVDAIILCTGYKHHFPFLPDSLRLRTTNRLWVDNLHKGIFWMANPKLMYLGMQDQWYTFNMFDAQAWYARDAILGREPVATTALSTPLTEMRDEFQHWRSREEGLEGDEANITFQGDYVRELIDATDYPSFDIPAVNATFLEWEHNKHDDIMGFRNHPHRSVITGTLAPIHHTPWLEALDDSMECYLRKKELTTADDGGNNDC